MKLSIYGVGYVGLVTGICLAKLGHNVCCYDINTKKIRQLQKGKIPIYEAGLNTLFSEAVATHNIIFTSEFSTVAEHSLVHMIAVGTPPQADGSADLSQIQAVVKRLLKKLKPDSLIINKSTVPVGTADTVRQGIGGVCDVVSNPEFLQEGRAVPSFMSPERIIIGTKSERAIALMRELYAPLIDRGVPLVILSPRSSELTKYASNAFLATKISFMNEMSQLAERLRVDINEVKLGMSYDRRIGDQFLNAGCGYGGSCFPKDIAALRKVAEQLDYRPYLLEATHITNEQQKRILFDKILDYFEGDLSERCIALWGLAFKPGTDDIRSAPSLTLIESLWQAGAYIQAFDPMAMDKVAAYYGDHPQLQLGSSPESVLKGAHGLVIVTEWPQFLEPDFAKIRALLHHCVIFDGRNLYDPQVVAHYGLHYCAIGRGIAQVALLK